jgi:hypothetical protein
MKYRKFHKQQRKQLAKIEHDRRIKRLNEITFALCNGLTKTEKWKLITGEMRKEMDSFYKGLYKIV